MQWSEQVQLRVEQSQGSDGVEEEAVQQVGVQHWLEEHQQGHQQVPPVPAGLQHVAAVQHCSKLCESVQCHGCRSSLNRLVEPDSVLMV